MPANTTHERKFGKQVMVCTTFLNRIFRTSFIKRAKIMGTGKEKMIRIMLIFSVL